MPTLDQIKDFAVSYEALWDALRTPDNERTRATWNSVACWAGILKRAQVDVGVQLMTPLTLEHHADEARRQMDRIDAVQRGALLEKEDTPPHNEPTIDGVY